MYGTLKNRDEDKNEKGCGAFSVVCKSLWRVKKEETSYAESSLARVLNSFDLIILGIGSTLGVGVYVLAGEVSKNIAGPAVTISFLLAAITSVFAGLCYAEFGARVPKAGSAYAYSYYTVGEGIAFVIGWTLLIEYGIGAASVAKGISEYINQISKDKLSTAFLSVAPMDIYYLADYVDFFAAGLCLFLAAVLAGGVRSSTIANNIFTLLNLAVVLFVIISGFFKVDIKNWQIDPDDPNISSDANVGAGGFVPFGFIGVMQGAATCFYGFVGFDAIATTGEEVKNPQKAIPLAFIVSLSVIFAVYFGISSVLTLMWPFYDQSATAPFPHVYDKLGWEVPKWIVTIGACFGLFSSLFGAMFPLPRIIYSMSNDGLIFQFLGKVNKKTKTPIYGTIVSGLVTALMAGLFNLRQLVDMMSLGTLMAYSIVALCVLILRYSPDNPEESTTETTVLVEATNKFKFSEAVRSYFNCRSKVATPLTKRIVVFNLVLFIILSIGFAVTMTYLYENIFEGGWYGILILSIIVVLIFFVLSSVATQPKSQRKLSFQIPLLPIIPSLSIFCNIYLMVVLDSITWVRFAIWMAIGLVIYFAYGMWHSTEKKVT